MYEEDDDAKHESSVSTEVEIAADSFVGFCDFCLKATLSAVGGGVLAYVTADSESDPKAEKTKTQMFVMEILKIRGSTTFP
ncbi:unnamed protein product [Arabidopsis lyrata]|nr:unnamed protein product [Arabidopsis lyrata]